MRLFIQHDQKGNITSVSKTVTMDASLEHPFAGLAPGESVLEVELTSELRKLDCHEIRQSFAVDIKKKALRKLVVIGKEK